MDFKSELLEAVSPWRLLKHPFYKSWECGAVPKDVLKEYAQQYFHHVEAFPRYLSATHSNCKDPAARQEILKNLVDEELGAENHPELWMQFAEGMGNARSEVRGAALHPATKNLIETFLRRSSSSYAEGLAALFMYEEQTPEIAATKMEGLREHYQISDKKTLGYFALHKDLDIEHSAATGELVNQLPVEDREKAIAAATECAKALWGFLDGMNALIH